MNIQDIFKQIFPTIGALLCFYLAIKKVEPLFSSTAEYGKFIFYILTFALLLGIRVYNYGKSKNFN